MRAELPTVAALYVDPAGVYSNLPGVEVWDEARDARLYDGPWPVVAHPPCNTWSIMAQCRPEIVRGDDGGCFEAALRAVRTFGGVLEHPAYSHAWRAFGLVRPAERGWTGSLYDDGWTCQVDQGIYGHSMRKLTWLYCVGVDPPSLRWGDGGRQARTVRNAHGWERDTRSPTPVTFRDELLGIARLSALTLPLSPVRLPES